MEIVNERDKGGFIDRKSCTQLLAIGTKRSGGHAVHIKKKKNKTRHLMVYNRHVHTRVGEPLEYLHVCCCSRGSHIVPDKEWVAGQSLLVMFRIDGSQLMQCLCGCYYRSFALQSAKHPGWSRVAVRERYPPAVTANNVPNIRFQWVLLLLSDTDG